MCEGGNAFYQRVTVYIIAGYCRGVAIFVIFMDLQVMKFSTH